MHTSTRSLIALSIVALIGCGEQPVSLKDAVDASAKTWMRDTALCAAENVQTLFYSEGTVKTRERKVYKDGAQAAVATIEFDCYQPPAAPTKKRIGLLLVRDPDSGKDLPMFGQVAYVREQAVRSLFQTADKQTLPRDAQEEALQQAAQKEEDVKRQTQALAESQRVLDQQMRAQEQARQRENKQLTETRTHQERLAEMADLHRRSSRVYMLQTEELRNQLGKHMNDLAGVLDAEQTKLLDDEIKTFEALGINTRFLILKSLRGFDIATYSNDLMVHWNDRATFTPLELLVLISVEDRKIRLETVGNKLANDRAQKLIEDDFKELAKSNNLVGGVFALAQAIGDFARSRR